MSLESKNPWKYGYWYNKSERFMLSKIENDERINKNLVCLDCPEIKSFMNGPLKYGDFGPAHEGNIDFTPKLKEVPFYVWFILVYGLYNTDDE